MKTSTQIGITWSSNRDGAWSFMAEDLLFKYDYVHQSDLHVQCLITYDGEQQWKCCWHVAERLMLDSFGGRTDGLYLSYRIDLQFQGLHADMVYTHRMYHSRMLVVGMLTRATIPILSKARAWSRRQASILTFSLVYWLSTVTNSQTCLFSGFRKKIIQWRLYVLCISVECWIWRSPFRQAHEREKRRQAIHSIN